MDKNLIIFDWDDTLLPTTWLQGQNLLDPTTITADAHRTLAEISESVLTVLRQAQMHGRVIIVTNAGAGWVEHSCGRFLPACQSLIDTIHIISARAYAATPTEWKSCTFQAELGMATNIVSIGDSEYERQAAATLVGPGRTVKSLKLEEKPSTEKLKAQLTMLGKILEGIVFHTANMDIVCSYLMPDPEARSHT